MSKRAICLFLLIVSAATAQIPPRWAAKAAKDWYTRQPWLVGSNYIPSYAVNQLEMWQAETFDPARIDKELGWAENIGLNTMRVFLHDLLWQQDAAGFKQRIREFLKIADKHHMRIMFVLFDSCWDPSPQLGPQRAPRNGIHNSGWVQGPGAKALADPEQTQRLLAYAKDIVADFSRDERILAWDLWNEPENMNRGSYDKQEPANKVELVAALLPKVFKAAREGLPTQPLTSALYQGDWSDPETLSPIQRIQLDQSDVLSFHNYGTPREFEACIRSLKSHKRPIFCTEYMARTNGSTFQGVLPIARKEEVAAYNWGLVKGKTQTWLPWDSWEHPYTTSGPASWFHDIFTTEGAPYRQREVDFIHEMLNGKKLRKAS
jgi:hypothetical protein